MHPLLQALVDLDLPEGDYAVFGSGPLLARGWIDEVGDLDVIARGAAWARARTVGTLTRLEPYGVEVVDLGNGITVGTEWAIGAFSIDALIDGAEVVNGIPCVRLGHVAAYKRISDRPKDRAHLAVIEERAAAGPFDFTTMPRLETERLVLREMRPDADLQALFDLFADPEVAGHTDTGPFTTMAEAVDVMDWVARIFAERRGMRWAVVLRTDEDALIGSCGYNHWRRWSDSAVVGYDLMRKHWGRGLMTEALRAMIGFGFARMALNRVEADVTVGNDASARVLEKLGFREEGLLRQRGHWKGAYHDLRLFGLLREDWTP